MNQYDIDLLNFTQDLLLSEIGTCEWLNQSIPKPHSLSWPNEIAWNLINLELSLNPEVNAYQLGIDVSKSCEAQDILRLKLLAKAKDQKGKCFRRPKVIPEDFLKLIWSWIKDEYEFSLKQVRNDLERGLILRSEAYNIEFHKFLADEFSAMSEILYGECESTNWLYLDLDHFELGMNLKQDSRDGESFERIGYGLSTSIVSDLGCYNVPTDRVLMDERRITAFAGLLESLISECGVPTNLPSSLCHWLTSLPKFITAEDIFLFILLHELGHRNNNSFKKQFGFNDDKNILNKYVFEELIADLYALFNMKSSPDYDRFAKILILYRLGGSNHFVKNLYSSSRLSDCSKEHGAPIAAANILAHVAVSSCPEIEISRFFELLTKNIEVKANLLETIAVDFTSHI